MHHDGGVRFGETHHLAQGTAAPVLRAPASFGVRCEVAELAFAPAGIMEDGSMSMALAVAHGLFRVVRQAQDP